MVTDNSYFRFGGLNCRLIRNLPLPHPRRLLQQIGEVLLPQRRVAGGAEAAPHVASTRAGGRVNRRWTGTVREIAQRTSIASLRAASSRSAVCSNPDSVRRPNGQIIRG